MALFNILVDIAAKTADFESGIRRVENQLQSFGDTARKALEFAGIGIGLHELVSDFDEFVNRAAELEHTSQKIGIAAEDLSRLQFAASQVNIASDALTTGIERFAKTAEAAAAGSEKQAQAFAAIGVAVQDASGQIKPMNELLEETATKFAGYKDSVEKTALAQALFSRAGADLIPLLNKGAVGIQELEKRSDELGNTITDSTIKAAAAFNTKLGELHGVVQGLWQSIAAQLLPSLSNLVDGFSKAGVGAEKLDLFARSAATGVKFLATIADVAAGVFRTLGQFIGAEAAALDALVNGRFKAAWQILKDGFSDVGHNIKDTMAGVGKLWDENANQADAWKDGLKTAWDSVANAAKTNAPIISKSIFDMTAEMDEAFRHIELEVQGKFESSMDRVGKEGEAGAKRMAERIPAYGKTTWDQMDEISQAGAKNIQGAFANFLFDPASKGLKGLVTDFANALKRMLADAIATDLFGAIFGKDKEGNSGLGGILGGLLGSFIGAKGGAGSGGGGGSYGGGRASGGPIESGKWYVAGEHGPEPIWGGGAGAFATGYGQGSSGDITIAPVYNIDARGATTDLVKALPGIMKQNNDALEYQIVTKLRRQAYAGF